MLDHIQERIDNDCFQSLQDLKLVIRNVFNVQVCTSTIFNAIEGFKYSLKRVQCIAVAADTPANEVLRLEFANWFIEMRLEGRTMIKVDETGFAKLKVVKELCWLTTYTKPLDKSTMRTMYGERYYWCTYNYIL